MSPDSYTVVFASFLITGALADRFGRRRMLLTGMAIVGVASLLCALAPSFGVLPLALPARAWVRQC